MIHTSSDVQTKNIGKNTTIWQYVVVLERTVIGDNCNICAHCFIENDVVIGNNVTIKCGVSLWDGMTVEDNVFIGPNVSFTNDRTPRSKQYPDEFQKIVLGEGSSVGANATILGGIKIGRYSLIGIGSIVTKDVPDFALVYGSPAIVHGYVCKCGKKLDSQLECISCELKYKKTSDGLIIISE